MKSLRREREERRQLAQSGAAARAGGDGMRGRDRGRAESLRIESVWSTEAPAIDGKLAEWSSPLVTLGSTKLSLGVRNDGQFLYVALASSDQATRMMLGAAGFTVWLDPAGKEKKTFGVTVPPAMAGAGNAGPRAGRRPGRRASGQGAPAEPGQEGREGQPGGQSGPAISTITQHRGGRRRPRTTSAASNSPTPGRSASTSLRAWPRACSSTSFACRSRSPRRSRTA